MEFMSSIYKSVFSKKLQLNPKEHIKAKANIYFINEQLKTNKLAFAFFLDNYKPLNKQAGADIASLKKYEWFAGSLTAEQFATSLHEFLQSSHAENLTPELRQKIKKFASDLQQSEEQGYRVDLIRSTDLKLIFLILTGIPIGGQIDVNQEDIKPITQYTLNQLQGLKPGEKRNYLAGNLFHETRLSVEKKEAGWEVVYFDSNSSQCKIFASKDPSPLLDPPFWDKVYSLKFKPDSLSDLTKHLESHLDPVDVPRNEIRVQNKNTCHFRGLLAALKHECLVNLPMDPEEGLRDWKAFKIAFGNYLMQNPNLNSKIKILASDQQDIRSRKTELTKLHQDMIRKGRGEESIKAYLSALHILGSKGEDTQPGLSQMKILEELDDDFKRYMRKNVIHLEEIEPRLKALNNPCINYTMEIFIKDFRVEQKESESKLDEALSKAREELHPIIQGIKDLGIFKTEETDAKFIPVSKEKLRGWLNTVAKEPKLLTNLDQKPFFAKFLVQGIYVGEAAKVIELYEQMDPIDKKALLMAEDLAYFIPFFGGNISESVFDIYYAMPSHPLMEPLKNPLFEKAVSTSSLQNIYLLEKFHKGRMPLLFGSDAIRPNEEQIEAFFSVVKEEDLKLSPSLRTKVKSFLYILMHQAIKSGEIEILLKKVPKFLYVVISDFKSQRFDIKLRNEDALNKLEFFQASQKNEVKLVDLREAITLNQYSFKQFDKLLDPARSLEITSRPEFEFYIDVTPEDVASLQKILLKSKSKEFDALIISNFLQSGLASRDKNCVVQFLKFCCEHKRDNLILELSNPGYIPEKNRLFILECILDEPAFFDDELIERIIYMNLPFLKEETLHKIDSFVAKTNKKEFNLESEVLMTLPEEILKKYPDSLLVKKCQSFLPKKL